jgi:hypothetical protein
VIGVASSAADLPGAKAFVDADTASRFVRARLLVARSAQDRSWKQAKVRHTVL